MNYFIRRMSIKSCYFLFFFLSLLFTACLEPIEVNREPTKRKSFGEEVYLILYDNTVRSPDKAEVRASTFEKYKTTFVTSVDDALPVPELEPVNQVFKNIVPLYESQLYQGSLRKIAIILDELSRDNAALEALSYLDNSPSYISNPAHEYLIAHLFKYEGFSELSLSLLSLLLKNSTDSHNATNQLLKAISIEAKSLSANDDPDQFLYTVFDRLLDSDPSYQPSQSWVANDVVRLDRRGIALLNPEETLSVFAPFVDKDGDNLADVDIWGNFILANDLLIAPFQKIAASNPYFIVNNKGHLTKNGHTVFQYFDIHSTPLAYLIREGDNLLQDKTLDEAIRATRKLLSYSQGYEDEYGTYRAYTDKSVLYQLAFAILQIIDHDELGPNLEALIILLKDHPDTIAKLLYDFDLIIDLAEELDPDIRLNNNLLDELLPLLLELVQTPGLLEDLLIALNDPLSQKIAPALAYLASIRKDFITVNPDGAYETCFRSCNNNYQAGTMQRFDCLQTCPKEEILGNERIDHWQPETASNRSIFQRIMALMWETSEANYGAEVESLIANGYNITPLANGIGPLMQLDNLAMLYLHTYTRKMQLINHINPNIVQLAEPLGINDNTVAGVFTWIVQQIFKLSLDPKPSTEQVTRFFNQKEVSSKNDNFTFTIKVANCNSKRKCINAHADTLYAIEATGLVDALTPVISVFNRYDKTALFAKLSALIYKHFPSGSFIDTYLDGTPLPFYNDNYRSIEPLLIKILEKTKIIESLGEFSELFTSITLSDGSKILSRLSVYMEFLLSPNPALKNALGLSVTYDPQEKLIAPISPAYLVIDPLREIVDLWDKDPQLKEEIKNAASGLAEVTIKTIKNSDGSIGFEKPAGIKIAATFLQIILDLFERETANNRRHSWINDEALVEVKNFFTGRLLYAFFQLFEELDKDPEALERVRKFTLHVMESGENSPTQLTLFAYQAITLLYQQKHLSALARFFSSPIDPDREWKTGAFEDLSFPLTIVKLVHEVTKRDPDAAFNRFFFRLFETEKKEQSNINGLLKVGKAMFRQSPGTHLNMQALDYKALFEFAYDFFTDEDRGVERIYKIIEFTIWGTAGRPADWKPSQNEQM